MAFPALLVDLRDINARYSKQDLSSSALRLPPPTRVLTTSQVPQTSSKRVGGPDILTTRKIPQHHPKRNNTLHRHIRTPPSNEGFSLLSKEKRYPKKTSRLDVLCNFAKRNIFTSTRFCWCLRILRQTPNHVVDIPQTQTWEWPKKIKALQPQCKTT